MVVVIDGAWLAECGDHTSGTRRRYSQNQLLVAAEGVSGRWQHCSSCNRSVAATVNNSSGCHHSSVVAVRAAAGEFESLRGSSSN